MNQNRRDFLKLAGVAGIGLALPLPAQSKSSRVTNEDLYHLLIELAKVYKESSPKLRKLMLNDLYKVGYSYPKNKGREFFHNFAKGLEKSFGGAK